MQAGVSMWGLAGAPVAVDPVLRRWVRPSPLSMAGEAICAPPKHSAGVRAVGQAPPRRPAGLRCTKQLCRAPGPPSHSFARRRLGKVARARRLPQPNAALPPQMTSAARCAGRREPSPTAQTGCRGRGLRPRRANQPRGSSAPDRSGHGVSQPTKGSERWRGGEERAHHRWSPAALAVASWWAASPVFRGLMTSLAAERDAFSGRPPPSSRVPAWCEHRRYAYLARPNLAPTPALTASATLSRAHRPAAHGMHMLAPSALASCRPARGCDDGGVARRHLHARDARLSVHQGPPHACCIMLTALLVHTHTHTHHTNATPVARRYQSRRLARLVSFRTTTPAHVRQENSAHATHTHARTGMFACQANSTASLQSVRRPCSRWTCDGHGRTMYDDVASLAKEKLKQKFP